MHTIRSLARARTCALRRLFAASSIVAALAGASTSTAHAAGIEIDWYASRTLAEQTDWSTYGANQDAHLRRSYVLAELSSRAYFNAYADRDVNELGFRELAFISERVDIPGGAEAGDAYNFLLGGPATVLVGEGAISNRVATASATVVEAWDGSVRAVALRGSADLDDMLLDVNAATVNDGIATYHHGFYTYASIVFDEVYAALGKCSDKSTPLWITGHSLGGAAAQILAYGLARKGCNVTGVVTFGAPAPGRSDFQTAYTKAGLSGRTHRWVNALDPVVCLPFGSQWPRLGAQHIIDDSALRLNDSTDTCDGSGQGTVAEVTGFLLKVHAAVDHTSEFNDWILDAGKSLGMCDGSSKVSRVIWGILTLGASEITCKTAELVSDFASTTDQLLSLYHLLIIGKQIYGHVIDSGYLNAIVSAPDSQASFCAAIWRPRLEQLGTSWCPERFANLFDGLLESFEPSAFLRP